MVQQLPSLLDGADPKTVLGLLQKRIEYGLPQAMGIEVIGLELETIQTRMIVASHHLAINGFMHAAAVIGLADTTTGFGCVSHLPSGASNFTTIELKSNFLGTVTEGTVFAEGKLRHGGRSTQVWDAEVRSETGKTLALFRCTQMILYR